VPFDGERQIVEVRRDVAIPMTAIAKPEHQGCGEVLEGTVRDVSADRMLIDVEQPAGFQDAAYFPERRGRVGDSAEDQVHNDRIETLASERQPLGISGEEMYVRQRFSPIDSGKFQEIEVRICPEDCDPSRIVAQQNTRAAADVQHAPV
jgi:hypothetical protein